VILRVLRDESSGINRLPKNREGSTRIKIKRVYEEPEASDGYRVLVDRLWPRGVSKERAQVDLWFKDLAPSNELRQSFAHRPENFADFKERYFQELSGKSELLGKLRDLEREKGTVTLLFSDWDTERNNAAVLKEYLEKQGG